MTDKSLEKGARVAIIGAGIIGVTSAFELVRRGYAVTGFDPFPPGIGGPSRRNVGHIAGSDIHPLAKPGIALAGLKMMLRKDSPLHIPGMEKIRLKRWFLRFLATANKDNFRTASLAITYLNRASLDATESMLKAAGMSGTMTRSGAGFIYDSARSLAASQPAWNEKTAAGFTSWRMDRDDIARTLPELNPAFVHGMLSQSWAKVSDPLEIVTGLGNRHNSLYTAAIHGTLRRSTAVAARGHYFY